MKLLKAFEKRPGKLEQLFKALLSIPPTSVEAERAFSAAGLFTTKLCNQKVDEFFLFTLRGIKRFNESL